MGAGSIQRKETQRPNHRRKVQHLQICRLQRPGDRFVEAGLYGECENDGDCEGDGKSTGKIDLKLVIIGNLP